MCCEAYVGTEAGTRLTSCGALLQSQNFSGQQTHVSPQHYIWFNNAFTVCLLKALDLQSGC